MNCFHNRNVDHLVRFSDGRQQLWVHDSNQWKNTEPRCGNDEIHQCSSCNLASRSLPRWLPLPLHLAKLCWAITKQIHCTFIMYFSLQLPCFALLSPVCSLPRGNFPFWFLTEKRKKKKRKAEIYFKLQYEIYKVLSAQKREMNKPFVGTYVYYWLIWHNRGNHTRVGEREGQSLDFSYSTMLQCLMELLQNAIYNIEHFHPAFCNLSYEIFHIGLMEN